MKAILPKRSWKNQISKSRNYVTVYPGLTEDQLQKLNKIARETGRSCSEILREAIDQYLKTYKDEEQPVFLRKQPIVGLKVVPRTIRRDQEERIREISQKTGKKMSEVMREALSG